MTPFEIVQAVASLLTVIGVWIAANQLRLAKQQAQAQFEEGLNERYRMIASELPLDALLGKDLSEAEIEPHLRAFYNYFDLSNEQAFLAARGKLQPGTWANWSEGIEQHLQRGAFRTAWNRLAPHLDGSFDNIRAIVARMPGTLTPVATVANGARSLGGPERPA